MIGAPESVVGIAATAAPRTAATAFAESITRPPPSATSRSDAISSTIAAEASGTLPAGTRWVLPAPSPRPEASERAREVESSSKSSQPSAASVPSGWVTGPP